MLLMVKKGNPSHISDLASLSGKSVAVEAATTEKATLDAENKTSRQAGQAADHDQDLPRRHERGRPRSSRGKVDAYFADATPVLYYIKKNAPASSRSPASR